MAKPEWGAKRQCQSCGARFYDLLRTPITCPKCNALVENEAGFKPRRAKALATVAAGAAAAAAKPNELEIAEDDVEVEDIAGGEADESGLMEDASDLGEDDDDMAEVIEHMDENIEDEV